jgi:hypothetical protein
VYSGVPVARTAPRPAPNGTGKLSVVAAVYEPAVPAVTLATDWPPRPASPDVTVPVVPKFRLPKNLFAKGRPILFSP